MSLWLKISYKSNGKLDTSRIPAPWPGERVVASSYICDLENDFCNVVSDRDKPSEIASYSWTELIRIDQKAELRHCANYNSALRRHD